MAIQEELQKVEGIAFEKHQVYYLDPENLPILDLLVFKDSFQYKECVYICRSKRGIQEHYRVQHRWLNQQKRGRQKIGQDQNKMQEEGQHYQRFFEFAQQKRYFQVSKQLEQDRQHGGAEISNTTIERLTEELKESIAKKRKEREIEGSSSRYLPNPQLDFVGQDEHLKKFKRLELLKIIEPSEEKGLNSKEQYRREKAETQEDQDQEDRGLAQVCVVSQRLIRRAIATYQPSIVGRSALEFVNRREVGEGKNERPFYAKHKASTKILNMPLLSPTVFLFGGSFTSWKQAISLAISFTGWLAGQLAS